MTTNTQVGIYYWIKNATANRPLEQWWYQNFMTVMEAQNFLQIFFPHCYKMKYIYFCECLDEERLLQIPNQDRKKHISPPEYATEVLNKKCVLKANLHVDDLFGINPFGINPPKKCDLKKK